MSAGSGRSGRRSRAVIGALALGVSLGWTSPTRGAPPPSNASPGAAKSKSGKSAASDKGAEPASSEALILPTLLKRARRASRSRLRRRAAALDVLLTDTAQDLGLTVDLTDRSQARERLIDEHDLVELAQRSGKLTVLPIIHVGPREREEKVIELRVVAARPGSRNLSFRVERIASEDLPVRAVVMLRDLVTEKAPARRQRPPRAQALPTIEQPTSAGRAILAVNGTIFGGFLGYSLQRSSGSDDPRLLYPLLAVGAGVGLGSAIIVADEWDVGVGEAWYLAAGTLWPAVGSHLIYEGHFSDQETIPEGEQWAFGLVASTTGLVLSGVGLLDHGMGDGGAALAHSGGGAGLVIGALAELAATGSDEDVPLAGMGYGTMAGWLLGATTAIHIDPPVDRVLTIGVGSALGGLAGASAASPLLFEDPTPAEMRGWVAAAGGGMLVGAGFAWYLSRDEPAETEDDDGHDARHPAQLVYRWGAPQPTLITTRHGARTSRAALRTPLGTGESRLPPGFGVEWQAVLW